ncbi:hypothetical protein K470DRAFT_86688 [Piedraia hortae CBS 480.64]|uniref:Invertebrate defensins family profile domain-containing protein n=1 Tax=Piedraia hortae CBS 480.64 TaxID=1314780 RepID=A0A6A7BYE7_9PEZI|nr:hypothetical protein K470DRAFT_86688 [Piedraia hortae CBS 480.64]
MQFTKIFALLPVLALLAGAAPVADVADVTDVDDGNLISEDLQAEVNNLLIKRDPEIVKRGFGCPLFRQQCNDHCISLKGGRTGGYCSGTFRLTCTCVFG